MTGGAGFGLRVGAALAGVGVDVIWWRYAELGGTASVDELAAHVGDCGACDPVEHNLIAQSLNEIYLDNGLELFPVAYVTEPPMPAGARATLTRAGHAPSAAVRRSMELRVRAARAHRQGMDIGRAAVVLRTRSAWLLHASRRLDGNRRAT